MIEKSRESNSGDIGDIPETGKMSLGDKAKLAALIEQDGDVELRVHLLGALGRSGMQQASRRAPRELPATWTVVHVLDRLEEAYAVLGGMPMVTRPKAYGNAMPAPMRDKMTNKDWIDLLESGEIEQLEEDRNRVRLAPTTAQITRMEQALRWSFDHLRERPELAQAVSLRAMWAAARLDIRKQCERRSIEPKLFNQQWHEGVRMIAAALIAKRVPVS